MSAPKKQGVVKKKGAAVGAKKGTRKPLSFGKLWNKLVRKKDDPKSVSAAVSEKTVKRAVAKVAKNLHLKKKERQQVASVLAAEVHQRAMEEKVQQQHRHGPSAAGEDNYPVEIPKGLGVEEQPQQAEQTAPEEPQFVALDQPLVKDGVSDLEKQRRAFLEKSGGSGKSKSSSGGSSTKMSYSKAAFGEQPESVTLDASAVHEINSHFLINMLREVLTDASIRQQPSGKKKPEDMNADELVQLRRESTDEWNALVKENTVVSYALSKPREDDQQAAKKSKEKTAAKRKPLKFDDKVEVIKAPCGRDFNASEKRENTSGSLKRA